MQPLDPRCLDATGTFDDRTRDGIVPFADIGLPHQFTPSARRISSPNGSLHSATIATCLPDVPSWRDQ
jgi:hypothetical protein